MKRFLLFITVAVGLVSGQSFTISTNSGNVSALYLRIEGTSSGYTKPMWFETYAGSVSPVKMIDFGAFKPDANWFFIARHLVGGVNIIRISAVSDAGQILSKDLTLSLVISDTTAVRPRPMPAEIWWGGLGNNQQLMDNPGDWNFVKKYSDAYFFHTYTWPASAEKIQLMKSIISQTSPYGGKFSVELGGGTRPDDNWPNLQFNQWGATSNGFLFHRWKNTGLVLSEVTHDFQPNWKDFATAYPSYTEKQCVDKMTTLWIENFKLNYEVFPHIKFASTQSPVWWRWQNHTALGGNERDKGMFDTLGKHYSFDMYDVMNDFKTKSQAFAGHEQWAFYSDHPYYCMTFGGGAGLPNRKKEKAYEQWLQSNSCRHTAVCIEDPGSALATSDPDEWHRKFTQNGFQSLVLRQKEGHRANRYLFESWYEADGVQFPTKVTPEDDGETYTGMVKRAIKYLKGIKDTSGTLEHLTLQMSTSGNTTTFKVTNNGDCICMPALTAVETGDATITTKWLNSNNQDITTQVKSAEGWVDTTMLAPNQTHSILCIATVPQNNSGKKIILEAFWNPQDPTGIVRDRKTLTIGTTGVNFTDKTMGATAPRIEIKKINGSSKIVITKLAKGSRARVSLFSVSGKIIFSSMVYGDNAIAISSLPAGLYLVKFKDGSFNFLEKMFVEK